MADFSHLLDEVDEALHQEEENEHDNEEASTTLNDLQQQQPSQEEEEEGEEWDRGDREQLDVPAALEELAQRRLLDPSLAGGDYGEDGDKDDDSAIEAQELMDGTDTANGNSNGNEATNAYRTLKKGWQQEVACPELLPFDEDTVNTISQELGRRDDIIAQLSEQAGTDVEALMESVMKVDMARAKFVLTDLCRTRISKIQEHPVHMRDLVGRMSDHEVCYVMLQLYIGMHEDSVGLFLELYMPLSCCMLCLN